MSFPVFFSGGTAIAWLARYFARHGIVAGHLITTFDNGGSSAELRRAFAMPAPGDLRNRLLMLTPPGLSAAARRLLRLRFPKSAPPDLLNKQFHFLVSTKNPNWSKMPCPIKTTLRRALLSFAGAMPLDFNLANASVGNLALTGLYLMRDDDIGAATRAMASILEICGKIEPVTLRSLQLGAILADGGVIVGQEKFKNLPAPIEDIFLISEEDAREGHIRPRKPPLAKNAAKILAQASIICYPPGSFYSSVLANLKCDGVAEAISANGAPKIFIPNSGHDPEGRGMGILEQAKIILKTLGLEEGANPGGLLDYILVDSVNGIYGGNLERDMRILRRMGIKTLDRRIVCPGRPKTHLPKVVCEAILEMAGENA